MEAPGETWLAVEAALSRGGRGFPGGSSLAQLLAAHRGVRSRNRSPELTIPEIVTWADVFHARTGRWPTVRSGPVLGAPGETWQAVHDALYVGQRGLPGGSSLARLLARKRGVRNVQDLPPLTVQQIREWAEVHRRRTGSWPTRRSGPINEAPGETWDRVYQALYKGLRGLPGGQTLAQVLG